MCGSCSAASVVSTLHDPVDCSPPGSSVCGISQARILKWVAISFSGDLPYPGIAPMSLALQVDSLLPSYQGIMNVVERVEEKFSSQGKKMFLYSFNFVFI